MLHPVFAITAFNRPSSDAVFSKNCRKASPLGFKREQDQKSGRTTRGDALSLLASLPAVATA